MLSLKMNWKKSRRNENDKHQIFPNNAQSKNITTGNSSVPSDNIHVVATDAWRT